VTASSQNNVEKPFILTAGRKRIDLPMQDPIVAAYVNEPAAIVPALIHQINERQMYDFAFAFRKNMVFLDLGANMGLVSLYASDVSQRIVAVEPAPVFSVLEKIASYHPVIEPVRVAITKDNGPVDFHVNDVNLTASSVVNTYGETISVQGWTLYSLIREKHLGHVDLCKCDIEGSECEALNLREVTLAKDVIKAYYVEVHNCPSTTWEFKLKELVTTFIRVGYRHMRIIGDALYASYDAI